MTPKPTTTRTLRTPAEKAIAALGVEQRRVERLQAKRTDLTAQLEVLDAELLEVAKRRDYLAQHPDLPEADTHHPAPAEHGAGTEPTTEIEGAR